MGRFPALVGLELRRRLRDPVSMIVWLAIPFLMVALMAAVFGRKGDHTMPRVTMVVVDHDQGIVAKLLSSAFESGKLATLLDVKSTNEPEAQRIMDQGKASVMVVIPKGFSRGFLDNQPVTIRVYRNPQESILPVIGEDVIRFLATAGAEFRAAFVPLTEGLIDLRGQEKPTLDQVTAFSTRIYRVFHDPRASNVLDMDRMQVTDRHPGTKKASHSEVIGWFAPGIVAMALLFLCTGQSQEIQEDLTSGRLARAWTFASHPGLALAAKGTALFLTASATGALLVLALDGALGWHAGPAALLLLHLVAVAAAFSGLALLLRSLTKNPEAGGAAATGVMVGLGFLGGCFMPAIFLPPALRSVANVIPTGWAVQGFLILERASWAGKLGSIWPRIGGLLVTAVVCFSLAGWRMRRKVGR